MIPELGHFALALALVLALAQAVLGLVGRRGARCAADGGRAAARGRHAASRSPPPSAA